jgi:hypothetical protein
MTITSPNISNPSGNFKTFNICDWYWIIGTNISMVFSSSRATLVPITDPLYIQWLGTTPTIITTLPSWGFLFDVIYKYYLIEGKNGPTNRSLILNNDLKYITNIQKNNLTPTQTVNGLTVQGCSIVSISNPTINATYPLDINTVNLLSTIVSGLKNGGIFPENNNSLPWMDINGIVHNFTTTELINFSNAIEVYLSNLCMISIILINNGHAAWPMNSVTTIA